MESAFVIENSDSYLQPSLFERIGTLDEVLHGVLVQMKVDTFGTSDFARSEPEKQPAHEREIKRKLPGSGTQDGSTTGVLWSSRYLCPLCVV